MRYLNRELFGNYPDIDLEVIGKECKDSKMCEKLVKLQIVLERIGKMSPMLAIAYILKVVGYEEFSHKNCASCEDSMKFYLDMEELKARGAMYATIREWMEYVKLEENMEEMECKWTKKQEAKVYLYTFHGAKGLEFNNVIIPHLNEGSVPYGKNLSNEELEEERRMFYVALTRSAKELGITYVENDTKKDTVSRFIKESAITVSK